MRIRKLPTKPAYVAPCWPLGVRLDSGRCSGCGASGFVYNNGHEFSACGVRGYRCMTCGTIKPERGC